MPFVSRKSSENNRHRIFVAMKIKNCLFIAFVFFFACGGKLSEEQRKKMRENMEQNEIRRITEAELTQAAYEYGRSIVEAIGKNELTPQLMNSIEGKYKVKVNTLQSGDSQLIEIERMIIEAYTSGNAPELSDNIQKLGTDSLLYTKPILRTRPDGATEFDKAISIRLSTKQVVLSIKN
jgi:hypothetical protein